MVIYLLLKGAFMMDFLLPNRELEKLTTKQKIEYFSGLKDFCMQKATSLKKSEVNVGHELITKIYPILRNYDYEIFGMENIPDNGNALFMCNHSNSHDFFTAHEIFEKIGINVSVLAALDDLNLITKLLFQLSDATLLDRLDKCSIEKAICEYSIKLLSGSAGVMFGEATWNLHPYRPMQKIKIGGSKIAAITEKWIVPTIFEYVEVPKMCLKESELYSKCVVKFEKPIRIQREDSLVSQTNTLQAIMEQSRLRLWKQFGIERTSDSINPEMYLNHTYLKKYGAFGYTYHSEEESAFLFSKNNVCVENEFHLDEFGHFVPGITSKKQGKIYLKKIS